MNIQINCKDNVDKDYLLYIYYNLPDWIEAYNKNKDNSSSYKYINGKRVYYRKFDGNWSIKVNIEMTCNGKTMYFKIKE